MGKFSLLDVAFTVIGVPCWVISFMLFVVNGGGGSYVMLSVSVVIALLGAWKSWRKEVDRRQEHRMTMKERELNYDLRQAKGWPDDPTEDSWGPN